MEMGERIYNLRKQKGLTLEELGNIVGVGKSTVRKWENGMIANMRRDKIAKLASALDTSPAYLMGWDIQESCIENIKNSCIEQNIPVSKLEKDLGFASGYISQARNTTLPMDKLQKISEYLGKSVDYFISDEETETYKSNAIPKEFGEVLLKYQFIAEHSLKGKEAVDFTLNREYEIAKMIESSNHSNID